MADMQALRERWGEERHEPIEGCPVCGGQGEHLKGDKIHPCLCIYVPHEDVEVMREILEKAFRETYTAFEAAFGEPFTTLLKQESML